MFCKKGVLRNFAKLTGKHLCQSLFFNKVARPGTLLKKRLWHKCFLMNFAKVLRTHFFTEHLQSLILFCLEPEKYSNSSNEMRETNVLAGKTMFTSLLFQEIGYFSEAATGTCSVKKVFLQILQNSQENTCARVFFLIKLLADTDNFIKKETLAQVFFCEFYKIFKNTFSCRTPPVAASNFY